MMQLSRRSLLIINAVFMAFILVIVSLIGVSTCHYQQVVIGREIIITKDNNVVTPESFGQMINAADYYFQGTRDVWRFPWQPEHALVASDGITMTSYPNKGVIMFTEGTYNISDNLLMNNVGFNFGYGCTILFGKGYMIWDYTKINDGRRYEGKK